MTVHAVSFKTQLYKYFGQCFDCAEFFRREVVCDLPFPNDEAVVRQLKGFLKEILLVGTTMRYGLYRGFFIKKEEREKNKPGTALDQNKIKRAVSSFLQMSAEGKS
ncbi:MAG TPA: hypothetical protein ENG23_02080 [Methanomicrobia archaeon]|nr:hypothetical protein [Methanomicrobia archaeon]